jgi:predicted aconitase with swiveling domain
MTNRIVFMARSKGSSSSSSVLAEAIRNETGPSAIIMLEKDLIVALGSIVARELYRIEVPIVVVSSTDWPILVAIKTTVEVRASSTGDAEIRWVPPPSKTF